MKRELAFLTALLLLATSISPALAAGSAWNLSQARMRKAWVKQQKAEDKFWKQFDAEIAKIEAQVRGKGKDASKSK